MKADKLYLVGFMGAGKTTVARAIGKRTGWRVEDIDQRIESREHRTVASIFSQQGEPYFRQLERLALGELLPLRHVVIATGGGTFVEPDNRALMLADGAVAWLDLSVGPGDRARACRWTPPARLRSGADGTTLRETATGVRAGARTGRCVEAGPRGVGRLLEWIDF